MQAHSETLQAGFSFMMAGCSERSHLKQKKTSKHLSAVAVMQT